MQSETRIDGPEVPEHCRTVELPCGAVGVWDNTGYRCDECFAIYGSMGCPCTTQPIRLRLQSLGACPEFLDWLADRDLSAIWHECERADWLLWLAAKINIDRRLVVRAACRCAREILPIFESERPGDDRPRKAIETAEAWCDGQATLDEVRSAAYAAAAARLTAPSRSWAAAYAAAFAAAVVYADTDAFYVFADVATVASLAAVYVVYAVCDVGDCADARPEILHGMAAMVREVIPYEAVEAAWNATIS